MRLGLRRRRGDWAAHEARAGALVDPFVAASRRRETIGNAQVRRERDFLVAYATLPDDVAASALVLLVREWAKTPSAAMYRVAELIRRPLAIGRADAVLAAGAAAATSTSGYWQASPVRIAAALLRKTLTPPLGDDEVAAVRALAARADRLGYIQGAERRRLRDSILRLLPEDRDDLVGAVVTRGDGWARIVRPKVVRVASDPDVAAFLATLRRATGSRPAKAWRTEVSRLVAKPAVAALVRDLVEAEVTGPAVPGTKWGTAVSLVVHDENADVARAAVWASGLLAEEWVVPALERIARRGFTGELTEKEINAAVLALGIVGDAAAIAALQRLNDATRHNGHRTRIATALRAAAESAGLTPGQLVERTVPDHGLGADGSVRCAAAQVTLGEDLKVAVDWAVPRDRLPAPDVSAVKRTVKELRDGVSAERRRVESLLADDRVWPADEWRRHYLDHPVTGRIARRLLWTVDGVTGFPDDEALRTRDGEVSLWHPARATVDEVAGWRDRVVASGPRQPFKQAFREVYVLTDAERATRLYSNRFAAHVLRYNQAYALMKERGWASNYLGQFDEGYEGTARRAFADAGLTAAFTHFNADETSSPPAYCSTDRVWFFRTGDRERTPVPLADVPPLLFSEAMRDVDLFVGVTSLALDPTWADRGTDPHYTYWLQAAFGELTPTAEVRRDALARLLPMLAVADRVSLDGRYVVVRGTRATYRIHIGSANVLMEPSGRYLCIVPAPGRKVANVLLPFEGDGLLTVILSKVALLARDDRITDPEILRQLPT